MASQLSLASATVTDDEGEVVAHEQPVMVRLNQLRIGVGDSLVHDNVQSVTQVARNVWEVTLPGSQVLTVTRGADCGCGR